jgi:hypothetical protein
MQSQSGIHRGFEANTTRQLPNKLLVVRPAA